MLTEPVDLKIPSEDDFHYDGDVDEKWAISHYLGKDIDFVANRYQTLCSLSMVHDFTLVGVKAFVYYIFGAFRFLQSDQSKGEQDVYSALPKIISRKLDEGAQEFTIIKDYLIAFCQWAIDNYPKFEIDEYVDIYGDVRKSYKDLLIRVCNEVP